MIAAVVVVVVSSPDCCHGLQSSPDLPLHCSHSHHVITDTHILSSTALSLSLSLSLSLPLSLSLSHSKVFRLFMKVDCEVDPQL